MRLFQEEVSAMVVNRRLVVTNCGLFGAAVLLAAAAALCPPLASAGSGSADEELTMPRPIPSSMVQPVYPEQEKADGIEGTVLLSLEVKSDGTIGSIKAEEEVKGHPAFTASALAAVGKWLFEPATKGGRPVDCSIRVPVRFVLSKEKKK